MRIGFLADFVPFLKASGNSLEVVDVTGMESVDTQFFGLYCCSLRELRLIDCRDVLGSFVNRPGYNQSLSLAEACPNLELLNLQGCQLIFTWKILSRSHFSCHFKLYKLKSP